MFGIIGKKVLFNNKKGGTYDEREGKGNGAPV